jgi:predicted PurR-regulated permease PerM
LSFLLAPFVGWLERRKCPRVIAVLLVVLLAVVILGVLSSAIGRQLYDLAYRLPDYKVNLINKTQAFRSEGDSVFKRVTDAFADVLDNVSSRENRKGSGTSEPQEGLSPQPPTSVAPPADSPPNRRPVDTQGLNDAKKVAEPIRVEVVDRFSVNETTRGFLGQVLGPLGTAAIVIVFVVFMMIEREDLRNRLIYLIGSRRLSLTTQALDDAAHLVSRYLLMQFAINAIFGLAIATGLFFIGVPNAMLWGAMAAVLRFVPFIGPWIAAIVVMALSLAVFDGWTRPILVLGLFLVCELATGNALEPWLYGASTGISKIGILVSAVFWTWLWGPVGLVMATPLTVCLTVIARYVPQMAFLNKMLSTEEVLPPEERFYQRLLALDPEEAVDVADEYLKESSLEAFYDTFLLPALGLAEEDLRQGDLDELRQRLVMDTIRELVEDLGTKAKRALAGEGETNRDGIAAPAPAPDAVSVLCMPAQSEADGIAAMMLAQLLGAQGVKALALSSNTLVGEMLEQVIERTPKIVCVSAVPPFAATHARYLCKRLRPKFPELCIVAGLWQTSGSTKRAQERLTATGIDEIVTTLADATERIARLASGIQTKR